MKHYKTQANEIMAIEKGQEFLVQDDWVLLTDEELYAELNPPKTEEQLQAELKQAKELAKKSLVVTIQSGKTFDGNEPARNNMLSALTASKIMNTESTYWKLADNTTAEVTVEEIEEALALSIVECGRITLATTIEELKGK